MIFPPESHVLISVWTGTYVFDTNVSHKKCFERRTIFHLVYQMGFYNIYGYSANAKHGVKKEMLHQSKRLFNRPSKKLRSSVKWQ